MTDYEDLMKRCQRGATNLNDANNLLAECYGMLGELRAQAITMAKAYVSGSDREHELRTELAALHKDAERYRWLRSRDLDTIRNGGVFAGITPQNLVINEETLDDAIDGDMAQEDKL